MAKAVKLADIAEQVGVSTVTVSKALSGPVSYTHLTLPTKLEV